MARQVLKNWETDLVDCPSASVAKLIATLLGGESITIKSLASSNQYHYVGDKYMVENGRGYKLESGETMTLTLPIEFGRDNYIEIWAVPSNAGEDVCWFKLISFYPLTEAST